MAAKPLPKATHERLAPAPAKAALPKANQIDQLIHERVRLGIISALSAEPSLTFGELKDLLGVTDGNLSMHARKLEEAGYVECRKSFADRKPQTEYLLTSAGRKALEKYVQHMEALIAAMRSDKRGN
ncbi:MAG: transcriptional regulator [Bryobacter sp.]|nr:transcriptional regulator [Bryobacter sp.]